MDPTPLDAARLDERLARDVFYLGRATDDRLDVLTAREGRTRAALLFTGEAGARRHLPRLPDGYAVRRADDDRAKEELLRAALGAGATLLSWDADAGTLAPAEIADAGRALDLILSRKTGSACL